MYVYIYIMNINTSLEKMFLSESNKRDMSAKLRRNTNNEMTSWALTKRLDDYESVRMDYGEALDFANNEFFTKHKDEEYEVNTSTGQNYPKYYIKEGVDLYNVNDFREHNAQHVHDVIRSNANFRYGNKIKEWRVGQHRRHYDREEHENGFADTRELNTLERGYNMENIYAPNKYKSSDSIYN
jgi:hypothetical protein